MAGSSTVDDFVADTTIHGISHLAAAKQAAGKLVWVLAMLVAAVFFFIQATELCQKYHNEEIGSEITSWAPETIPPINVCPKYYLQNDKISENLNAPSDHAFIIEHFMDGFIPFGSIFRTWRGKIDIVDVDVGAESGHRLQVASFARAAAAGYNLLQRYNHSLASFIEHNSISKDEMFETMYISPLPTNITIRTDITWVGMCFHVQFEVEVNKFQLQFVQLDMRFKGLPVGQYISGTEIGAEIGYKENQVSVRVGEPSFQGIGPIGYTELDPGKEYTISIVPMRIERKSLRRKKCKDYTSAEHLYCVMDFDRQKCMNCKTMFPYEAISGNETECNYALNNGFCAAIAFERLNKKNTAVVDACPEPCAVNVYDIRVGVTRTLEDLYGNRSLLANGTLVHFEFRGIHLSTRLREYQLVSVSGLLSNFGGTMGLYFGASVLSIVHVGYHFVGSYLASRLQGVRKGKVATGDPQRMV